MNQQAIEVKISTPVNIESVAQALVDLNKLAGAKIVTALRGRENTPSAMVYRRQLETSGCETYFWVTMVGNSLGRYNPKDLDGIFTQADVRDLQSDTFEVFPQSITPSIDGLVVQ